jgi:hypothetical protein
LPSATCASATDNVPGVTTVCGELETRMSSTPTHSSLPTALVVMTRTWSVAALLAPAGSVAVTAVTWPARFGPCVASANIAGGNVDPLAGLAGAILERDLLGSIVARTVDVAQIVVDGDILAARGVEMEHDVRRIGGAGALERDRGVGDLELGDAAARQRIGIRSGWR